MNNIEIFLPRKSTMNMERKDPKAVPSFNEDTVQKTSLPVISKEKSSTDSTGDHFENRPAFNSAKHTVLT